MPLFPDRTVFTGQLRGNAMWWYGCSNGPSTFFGPIMMLLFMVACMAIMFFMMRRHLQPNGHGSAAFSDSRLGPWRNAGGTDRENRQTTAAFEEYREETLRRLEGEQTAFKS